MTSDLLLNGMKSLFAGLGAKTSDSNYGVALLDKTSGEPKGLMGMSDLASVLGGEITSLTKSVSESLVVGRPYGAGIHVKRISNEGGINALSAGGPSSIYGTLNIGSDGKLIYTNNVSSASSEWNFGCNTPADLANLLGGFGVVDVFQKSFDINNVTINDSSYWSRNVRITITALSSSSGTFPNGLSTDGAQVLHFSGIYPCQIFVASNGFAMRRNFGGWQPWVVYKP